MKIFRLPVAAAFALVLVFSVPAFARESAQAELPRTVLTLGQNKIAAEVADDDGEREAGLMFREKLGDGEGMLFVMPATSPASFWMKNTSLPLSIAYIDPSGAILEIHDLVPHELKPVRSRFPNVAYALEMRRGWFSDHNVFPGDHIGGLPRPAGE